MPVPPPQVIYPNLPRVEIVGEGERTNIYLPPPPPAQSGQTQNQGGNQSQQNNGQGQNNNGQERRRSSMLVQEVDRAVAIAKRLGEAVRRGSASSFGRGREYDRRRELERERERERERLRELGRERERELDILERGRAREREREKERERSLESRMERQRRNRRKYRQDSSSSEESRSRSRERRSKPRNVIKVRAVRGPRELKVVDEEARHLAQYAASTAGNLQREKDIKQQAKLIVEKKEKDEERLADRILSRYGAGGLLTPPPPPPRGRFKDWDADRDRGRDWREGVSWAPWNAQSYNANYVLGPPPPPVPPTAQAYGNNSGGNGSPNNSNGNGNGNGNGNLNGGGGRGRGSSRSRSTERRHVGSNHIHVHTAPLVQGPQISTTPGSAGAYGDMPGMSAASNSAGQRKSSLSDPVRGIARLLERGINASGYSMGGMSSGYGAAMPQLHSHTMGGSVPIYGMNGLHGMGGMGFPPTQAQGGLRAMPVPVGEREWQRARVYNTTTHDAGMGGMMY